jgi:Carboxypeptidase regulatory-like domain/TonB dependent receptor-like, beta-barrel
MRKALLAIPTLLLLTCNIFGQAFTGNITGVVTEPNGAVVPGAKVTLTNTATGESREVKTNNDGRYSYSQLKPSTYSLKISATGFKEYVRPDILISTNQSVEIDVQLTVGSLTEVMEVVAAAPLLNTTTQTQSTTLDSRAVTELPVNARNPFVLVHSTAGVVAVRTGISTATQDQNHNRFAMNGGRDETVQVLIDGIPATAGDWGGLIASPSVDSVQEAQIVRNTYEAQFGKTGGGVVNLVTKGGSREYHGTAFEYLRNDNLDANSFFNNLQNARNPEFKRHQFGGNFSGPIWKSKKLYGFFNFEALRQGTPTSRLTTVPTALERQGDFSQTRNRDGSQMVIYDPLTTRANPAFDPSRPTSATNFPFIRTPFEGNRIPTNRLDPVALNVLKPLPLPNQVGDPVTGFNNFFKTGTNTTSNDRYDVRVDWTASEKLSIFGRMTKARQDLILADLYENELVEPNRNDFNPRFHISLGATYVINPSLIANISIGGGQWTEKQISKGFDTDPTVFGLPSSLAGQFDVETPPVFNVSDYFGGGIGNTRHLIFARNVFNYQANLSKELAAHSLKFGWSLEYAQLNSIDFNSATFNFDRFFTVGPNADARNITTAGNSIASFLLGTGSSGNAPRSIAPAATQSYMSLYAQDAWRVNQRLTVNYGLRYEIQRGRTERYDRLNYFDFDVKNPIGDRAGMPNLKGGLVFVDENNRHQWEAPKTDFAPRVGFAYKLTDNLVVRAGYGIFYLATVNVGPVGTQGFSTSTPWVSTLDGGRTPTNFLRSPFPNGILQGAGASAGLLTQVGLGISAFTRERPTAYMQQYSLDFQYQLGNSMVLELGYVGNQGRRLSYGYNFEFNQLADETLKLGNPLRENVPNPFFGVITTGTLAASTVQRGQLLRPFPQFTSVQIVDMPGASSSYNALVAKLTRRFSQGLTLIASYQFSKAIDNASENQAWEISDRARNFNNLALERSISGHDIPHSLAVSYVYELPVGKGKPIGDKLHPVADAIIGGWQVSGIYKFDSGLPLMFTAPNNTFSFGGSQHPNVSDIEAAGQGQTDFNGSGDKKINRWFNTSVFSQPPDFTFGNAPRWFGNIRTDHTNNWDIAIGKNWVAVEKLRIQFRAEFFNAFNRVQFGRANTEISNAGFGQVRGLINTGPRNIQFGLRLAF